MTEQQFVYWLQGFSELHEDAPTPEQWKSIREHLATVFNKVTPAVSFPHSILKDNSGYKAGDIMGSPLITC